MSKNFFHRDTLKKNLRNIIAHTVNFFVNKDHFVQDLKNLDLIFNYGKMLFRNFRDPKLSYSEPFLLEQGINEDEL